MSFLFALAMTTAASAPLFNCMRASSKVERMICRDSELSAVDRAMAKLYSGVSSSGRKKLFTGQADWLKERDRCDDRECLLSTYDERFSDLFPASRTAVRGYWSPESNGTLAVLDAGDGWYAFKVVGLWIGSNPGQVNDTMEYGHFKLVNGKAKRSPTSEDCGWEIERLPRDRWLFAEVLPNNSDMIGCGGLNSTATGIYKR